MNDLILDVFGQFNKIGHIPGHSHQETGVLLRMLLSIDEYILVLTIDLKMMSPKTVVQIDQVDHLVQSLPAVNVRKIHVMNRAKAPVQTQAW